MAKDVVGLRAGDRLFCTASMEKIAPKTATNVDVRAYVSPLGLYCRPACFNEGDSRVNAPGAAGGHHGPKRASHIGLLMLELNRIANHLLWLGPFLAGMWRAQDPFFTFFASGR